MSKVLDSLRSLLRRRDHNQPPPQESAPPAPRKVVKVKTSWAVAWSAETRSWRLTGAPIRKSEAQRKRERRAALRNRAAA